MRRLLVIWASALFFFLAGQIQGQGAIEQSGGAH